MKRPGALTRLAGNPSVSILLFAGCGAVLLGWHQGKLQWWFALLALVVAIKTADAFGQMRKYNVWSAQWEEMGAQKRTVPAAQAADKKRKGRGQGLRVVLALALFIGITQIFPPPVGFDLTRPEVIAALLCLLYPILVVLRAIIRRVRRKAPGTTNDNAAPVSCMLSRTVDSPSRDTAVRNLPEYAARILNR
jgi:hypothetical protein